MSHEPNKPPVVFFIFRRCEPTARVLAQICSVQPARLWIIADGARPDRPEEARQVAAVRRLVAEGVDWDCDVRRLYAETNLGCAQRVASGLDRVFAEETEAIILEDDCLPHPAFFQFCQKMLERYRDEPRIAHIGGNNFQYQTSRDSYYFSRYNHIWGWATWRRAWKEYDATMRDWPAVRATRWLQEHLQDSAAALYWSENFDMVVTGRLQTWDYPWTYTLWRRDWLTVLPSMNLVQNIGFGEGGTHLTASDSWLARPAEALHFPLQHPARISRNQRADDYTERTIFSGGWLRRTRRRLRRWLRAAGVARQRPFSPPSRPAAHVP